MKTIEEYKELGLDIDASEDEIGKLIHKVADLYDRQGILTVEEARGFLELWEENYLNKRKR
jgi:hypothetical protein